MSDSREKVIDLLICSETVDDDYKEAGEEEGGERVSARGEAVRGGVRDDGLEATRGDNLVQGAEKTAEAHQGERKRIHPSRSSSFFRQIIRFEILE